jgi:hypothetical protein
MTPGVPPRIMRDGKQGGKPVGFLLYDEAQPCSNAFPDNAP